MKLRPLYLSVIFVLANSITCAAGDDLKRTIGVITFLSGPNATIGTAVRNGIELAREERPDLLATFDVQYEDDQSDPKRDVAAYQKMMRAARAGDKGLDVLFGLGPVMVNVLWSYVQRDQVPFVNFNFESSSVVGKPLVVRAMNHTGQYMQALATFLRRRSTTNEYPVIVGQHPFLQAMAGDLVKAFGQEATVREVATVLPNETDFRGLIVKLRKYEGRPVGLFLFPDSLIAFLKQAQALGFSALYFGTDLCESAAKLAQIPRLLDGCVYPDNEATDSFREQYRRRYGNEAQLAFAGSAYDMIALIGEVLQQHPDVRGRDLIKALSAVRNRRGVLGVFSFRDTKETGSFFQYPIHVKRIEDGRGVVVD